MSIYLSLLASLNIGTAAPADTAATKAELIAADAYLAAQSAKDGASAVLRALETNAAVLFPDRAASRSRSGIRSVVHDRGKKERLRHRNISAYGDRSPMGDGFISSTLEAVVRTNVGSLTFLRSHPLSS